MVNMLSVKAVEENLLPRKKATKLKHCSAGPLLFQPQQQTLPFSPPPQCHLVLQEQTGATRSRRMAAALTCASQLRRSTSTLQSTRASAPMAGRWAPTAGRARQASSPARIQGWWGLTAQAMGLGQVPIFKDGILSQFLSVLFCCELPSASS